MFSQRTRWHLTENAISAAVDQHRRAGRPLVDLTETNPTKVGLSLPNELVSRALKATTDSPYAPSPLGARSAREVVARYHRDAVSPERICLTSSTSEAYAWLFKLLCDPGDRVLVPAPGYPLFEYLAALESVDVGSYRCCAWDDWAIDFDHLRSQLTDRTRAIVLVSPNNPTGALLHSRDYSSLVDLCREHRLALISDEVFADSVFNREERETTLAGRADVLTFVLSGLSKVCLLPQIKAGWIATSGPDALVYEALSRLEVIADSYLSVSAPAQLVLETVLPEYRTIQGPLVRRLERNRRVLREALCGSSATVLPSDGGWSAVLRIPRTQSEQDWVLQLLREDGLLLHPGYFFDFESPGFVVVSLLPPEADFEAAVRRLAGRFARV